MDGPGDALTIGKEGGGENGGEGTCGMDCGDGTCGEDSCDDCGAWMSSGCHPLILAGGSHPNLNAVKDGQY